MRKWRSREVKWLIQSHPATKCWSVGENTGWVDCPTCVDLSLMSSSRCDAAFFLPSLHFSLTCFSLEATLGCSSTFLIWISQFLGPDLHQPRKYTRMNKCFEKHFTQAWSAFQQFNIWFDLILPMKWFCKPLGYLNPTYLVKTFPEQIHFPWSIRKRVGGPWVAIAWEILPSQTQIWRSQWFLNKCWRQYCGSTGVAVFGMAATSEWGG